MSVGFFVGGVVTGMCISPMILIYMLGKEGTRFLARSLKEYVKEELPPGADREDALDRLTKVENDMSELIEKKTD